MQAKPQVFLSYCRSDGAQFSGVLRDKLEKHHPEIKLWQDVISERGGRDWWLQITEALNHVEHMVLVLTPDAISSPMVRKEWRYARQQGVCIYPIQTSMRLNFGSLPRWIRDLHIDDLGFDEQRQEFTSERKWRKFINQLQSACETPRVPFMAEDLPENFVERPYEFERLVELLRNSTREEPIAITAALQGAGGFGKTTLAKAVCHDERIQEAFDDGILWTTLGENPSDLTSKVVDLIEVLSGERPGFKEAEAASSRLTELLADRDILLVIDDLWNAAHLNPFLNGGKRCARLITTRNCQTLPAATLPVNVDAMDQSEAVKLLTARINPEREHTVRLRNLAKQLGEWPLLLRLVNSVLRTRVVHHQQALAAALDYVENGLSKRGLTAFDARDPKARDQAVAKTLGVSLELLADTERGRLSELVIFPEDVDVPLSTVAHLWHATADFDEFDTEELCSRLKELSLLHDFDLTTRNIRLHDVMRRFLETQAADSAFVHGKLVDEWGDPHQLPEPYAWRFLAYHLVYSKRREQLCHLLLDFDWIRAKLEATDITSLISDYDYFAAESAEWASIQASLQLSAHVLSTKGAPTQLAAQILGRLLDGNSPSIQTLLNQAAENDKRVWLRPLTATLTSPHGPLRFTLAGHSAAVRVIAITPNEEYAISGSSDDMLKVWGLKTGQMLHTLQGHRHWVNAVAIAPNGEQAVSASYDHTLKVWELRTGRLLHTLKGHTAGVNSVVITPNGEHAVSASSDYTLRVWKVNTGQLLHTLEGHSGGVNAVAITSRGEYAVSASSDKTLKVWEIKTGRLLHTLEGHTDGIGTVTIAPNGEYAVSASYDRTLRVWGLKTCQLLHTLEEGSLQVNALAITRNGQYVVSASHDRTLKVWRVNTGQLLRILEGHSGAVNAVAITPDGLHAISASSDSTLKVWELKTGQILQSLDGHSQGIGAVGITPNGKYVVSASNDKTLKVWEVKKGQSLHVLNAHSNRINAVAITPDGLYAVSASSDNTLKVWEVKTGQLVHTVKAHGDWVSAVAITPDGLHAVSASSDQLKIWDVRNGEFLHTLEGHSQGIGAVAITPNGKYAVSASHGKALKVWDLKTGRLVHTLSFHTDRVGAVAITPDGLHAISASHDNTLIVWEVETGLLHQFLRGHTDGVIALAVTPDGLKAVSASHDNTLKVWQVKTGQLLHTLEGHSASVTAVAITPNGLYAVSASLDKTLKIWTVKRGQLLQTLEGHRTGVNAVVITPNGRHVVSVSHDNTLKLWDLKTGQPIDTFTADGPMNVCAITPDGSIAVAGDLLGRLHFLRIEEPQ